MIWEYKDFEKILSEFMPMVGKHDYAWKLLKAARKKGGRLPGKLESILKRTYNRSKPYFIFETSKGVKLLGDRRDRYSRGAAVMPDYEYSTANWIIQDLKKTGGTYIDAGTNMGIIASIVGSSLPDHQVIAIEPEPNTARRAAAAFALNGMKNATLYQAAVSDEDGEITFYSAKGRLEAASINKVMIGDKFEEIKVPMLRLDSIATKSSRDKIGFLKIDVEGHEPKAVRGAEEMIRRDHPSVLFEYHFEIAPPLGWTAEEVRDQIAAYNTYDYKVLHEDDPVKDFPPTRDMGEAVNVYCIPK